MRNIDIPNKKKTSLQLETIKDSLISFFLTKPSCKHIQTEGEHRFKTIKKMKRIIVSLLDVGLNV